MKKEPIASMTPAGALELSKLSEEEREAQLLIMAGNAIRSANRILVAEGKPQIGDPEFHVDPAYVTPRQPEES